MGGLRAPHLQGTQSLLCRGSQTHPNGLSAQPRGSNGQGGRGHSLCVMRPLALSGRFPEGRERHPDHLDTNDLEGTGGLQRKTSLGTDAEEMGCQ